MTLTTLTELEERSLKTGAQALFPCYYPLSLSSFKRITAVLSVPNARAMCNLLHAKKKMLGVI